MLDWARGKVLAIHRSPPRLLAAERPRGSSRPTRVLAAGIRPLLRGGSCEARRTTQNGNQDAGHGGQANEPKGREQPHGHIFAGFCRFGWCVRGVVVINMRCVSNPGGWVGNGERKASHLCERATRKLSAC